MESNKKSRDWKGWVRTIHDIILFWTLTKTTLDKWLGSMVVPGRSMYLHSIQLHHAHRISVCHSCGFCCPQSVVTHIQPSGIIPLAITNKMSDPY